MFTDQTLEYSFGYPNQHTPMTPQLHEDSSPILPTSPMDSLPATPNYPPSRDHILFNHNIQSTVSMESSPFMGNERSHRNLFVDTSLLPSSNSTYGHNQQEYGVSPQIFSPYATGSNNPSPLRDQVDMRQSLPFGRHKHSHSTEDTQAILGHTIQRTAAPGLRARSVPTSRQSSPYSYSGSGSNQNSPSAASNKLLRGGVNFPSGNNTPPSPTDSELIGHRRAVTTPKIRQASSIRRKYPANVQCDVAWCEDTFTTNFAKDRMSSHIIISCLGDIYLTGGLTIGHMKSHSGQKDHPCTIPGCDKRFTTDSGRKRHERSTTLHKAV